MERNVPRHQLPLFRAARLAFGTSHGFACCDSSSSSSPARPAAMTVSIVGTSSSMPGMMIAVFAGLPSQTPPLGERQGVAVTGISTRRLPICQLNTVRSPSYSTVVHSLDRIA